MKRGDRGIFDYNILETALIDRVFHPEMLSVHPSAVGSFREVWGLFQGSLGEFGGTFWSVCWHCVKYYNKYFLPACSLGKLIYPCV